MNQRSHTVRRLGPEDHVAFDRALDLFGRAFDNEATYGDARPGKAYRTSLLSKDDFILLVAEEGEEVIAALAAYEWQKFEQERSEFYIYDLAVDVQHRRKGVATALIEATKDLAARRNGWVVMVQADVGDGPAIALYSKMGVREKVLHFDIPID